MRFFLARISRITRFDAGGMAEDRLGEPRRREGRKGDYYDIIVVPPALLSVFD